MALAPNVRPSITGLAVIALAASVVLWLGAPVLAQTGTSPTLDRIAAAGQIVLGYDADARPFSFKGDDGQPQGFAIALCTVVADQVRTELGKPDLTVQWQEVTPDDRFAAVAMGRIDLLCGADSVTLSRRQEVSFSLPIFPAGTGAMMRTDAATGLREILSDEQPPARPIWRGSPARTFLDEKKFAVIAGSPAETWASARLQSLNLTSVIMNVATHDEGAQAVIDGDADVFFGSLPVLLDTAARSEQSGELTVLPRHFTYEPIAFALARGDEDFRLSVDRALSGAYSADGFRDLFLEWFGTPDDSLISFYKQTVLPE